MYSWQLLLEIRKKSPALSGTVDCNRYPVVISKKRYSLLCQHSETAKEKHVSFESTRQYDHPLLGDTTYAEKFWPVNNQHNHSRVVTFKSVHMDAITLPEVPDILDHPSAEEFYHLYYDGKINIRKRHISLLLLRLRTY